MTWKTPCVEQPELWTSDDPRDRAKAIDACTTTCTRLATCRAEADEMRLRGLKISGVHAGKDWTKGGGHGKTGRPRQPIEHGTTRGYQAHHRRGEQVCDDCRAAMSAYNKAVYEAAKGGAA